MFKRTTSIATSLALLLYAVGVQQAHTLNVFPAGAEIEGTQLPTPATGAEISTASPQPAPGAHPLNATTAAAASSAASNAQTGPGSNRSIKRRAAQGSGSSATPGKRLNKRRAAGAARAHQTSFAGVAACERNLMQAYYDHAGYRLIITSGYRTPAGQARAIYSNLRLYGVRYVLSLYRRKAAIREIVNAYRGRRQRPRRALVAMTRVIEAQVKRGVFISKHMLGRAFDVRSGGHNGARLPVLREVAQELGGTVMVEQNHYHVEL